MEAEEAARLHSGSDSSLAQSAGDELLKLEQLLLTGGDPS